MEKESKLINIAFALEESEEQGIIGEISLQMSVDNAEHLLREQEECDLVTSGAVKQIVEACASLNGYINGYFIKAYTYVSEEK